MELNIEEMQNKLAENAKVLTKFPKKSYLSKINEEPLYEFEMFKKNILTKNKKFFRFYSDKCLFFKDKTLSELKGICFYDFDLRVEFLYHSVKNSSRKLNDLVYGFKFIRKHDSIQITSENKEIFQTLLPYFRSRLNLGNFHANYRAIKKIGKGNFASVYLVECTHTGTQYAVKAFSKEVAFEEDKGKKSLINEIKIMRELDHINLIKFYEAHETDNSIYMILELLQGGNLVDYLKQHGKFSESEAAIFMRAILRGIHHMHKKNLMHRDLKPENILFRNSNEIKEDSICVVDFGLSTFVDEAEYLFVRCGTPGFVAPEVINLKDLTKKYDKICDIFSIGVIFHILLFGKSIFPGKTYNDILAQNRACHFNFSDLIYQKISKNAKDLLMRLLEINPEKRITACQALEHPFLLENSKMSLKNEEIYNIDAEEGHALKLYDTTNHESKMSPTLKSMPIEPFSPLRKYQNLTIVASSPLNKYTNIPQEDLDLITRHPILNGYTNTVGDLELHDPSLKKIMKDPEINSPQLKKDLNERNLKAFQLKLSNFNKETNENEERKNENHIESTKVKQK